MATTKIISDSRRALNDGTYPIKVRITFQRKQVYYSTPYSLTKKDFAEMLGIPVKNEGKVKIEKLKVKSVKKTKAELKVIDLALRAFEDKAVTIIKNLPFFTFELFEKHFLSNRIENNTVSNSFDIYVSQLKKDDRVGTAEFYEFSKRSLDKFRPKLKFTDITPEFLRNYERWMLNNNRSITTVGMNLRHLRSIFNKAIADELIPKEIYPFGRNKYEIPTGNNKKKAIPLSEIALIYNYQAEPGTTQAMAKDFWIFIYLCNGMNIKDVCLLKYKNIQDNILEFKRAKSIRTKRKVEAIRVVITEDVKRIIDTYGNKDRNPDNYIFPVLTKGVTAERERQLIQQFTHVVNDHMKEIALNLGLKSSLTTYTARHAFATILKRSGVSTSFISEALGHSNEKTTRHYLASFEDSQKMEAVKALTAFKEIK